MTRNECKKQLFSNQKNPSVSSFSSSKRIGAAKKEMEGFDLTLEEFNSISIKKFNI